MKKQSKAWTMKECDVLRKRYNEVSMEELKEMLPGRNDNSIYKKVQYLRKKGWIIRRSKNGN
jgi:predicted transcriptional regulator